MKNVARAVAPFVAGAVLRRAVAKVAIEYGLMAIDPPSSDGVLEFWYSRLNALEVGLVRGGRLQRFPVSLLALLDSRTTVARCRCLLS